MLLQGVVQSKAVISGLTWPNHGAVATASNAMSSSFLRTGPASAHALSAFGDDSSTSKLLSIANQVSRPSHPPISSCLLSCALEWSLFRKKFENGMQEWRASGPVSAKYNASSSA